MSVQVNYLKRQYNARIIHLKREYTTVQVGAEFRCKRGRLKISPSTGRGVRNDLDYLTRLLTLMVTADGELDVSSGDDGIPKAHRSLPEISGGDTSALSVRLKAEFARKEAEYCKPVDDPLLLELTQKYVGKIFHDYELRPPKTYKVLSVQYDNKGAAGTFYWEATCVQVVRGREGAWKPPENFVVDGNYNDVKASCLEGYMLVDLANPSDPTWLPWVDKYIARHLEMEVEAHSN